MEPEILRLQIEIERAREVHAQLAYALGVYFGYPNCCRMQFANDIKIGLDPTIRAIDGSGFTPCTHHFELIKLGEIRLSDLIIDRICPTPFNKIIDSKTLNKEV